MVVSEVHNGGATLASKIQHVLSGVRSDVHGGGKAREGVWENVAGGDCQRLRVGIETAKAVTMTNQAAVVFVSAILQL